MITAEPMSILIYAKQQVIERIMALVGRSSEDPRRYRQILERMSLPILSRTLRLIEAELLGDLRILEDFSHVNIATVEPVLTGAENEDRTRGIPALSLTANEGVIARRADKGESPTRAGKLLNTP